MVVVDTKEVRFYIYFITKDKRKHGIGGFSKFMKSIMENIIDLNGGFQEYSNKKLQKITLFIDSDYEGKEKDVVSKTFVQKEIVYIYKFNFDRIVKSEFKLEYFGDLLNSIIRIILTDYGISYFRIEEVCEIVNRLKLKADLKYVKYDI